MDTNMAQCLQQTQLCTAMTNLTITHQNEACNDHQTINSKEKKHIPLFIISFPLWEKTLCGETLLTLPFACKALLPAWSRSFFISLFFLNSLQHWWDSTPQPCSAWSWHPQVPPAPRLLSTNALSLEHAQGLERQNNYVNNDKIVYQWDLYFLNMR